MARTYHHFHPRLIDELRSYNRTRLTQDVIAGLTVGVVALPLAMAFAIASGVKPEAGIITAVIAGFLISALGGSQVQIGGPAGAFIIVVYSIIEKYGLANLLIATILAGCIMLAMGIFKLGSLIRFIPVSIVIGFTNGIAVLIGLSQMKDFFGLHIEKMPADFFSQLFVLASKADTVHFSTVLLGSGSLFILFFWSRFFSWIEQKWHHRLHFLLRLSYMPASIVVLVAGTLIVSTLGLNVATIGSKFNGIPQSLPAFTLPDFSWVLVKQLFAPSLTIALLGSIESLLCARVADNLTQSRHDPNQELMAQGIANIITPFFGGIPATGTIARTITNVRNGAGSPVAGIVHALTLMLIVLIAAPLAANIPLACLAAILLSVAFNMGEWREFQKLRHFTINYRIIMVSTFLLTVILDLSVAVEVGIMLACIFFIYRISNLTKIDTLADNAMPYPIPKNTRVYRVYGSLFFGSVDKLEKLISPHEPPPGILILECHQMINMDTTGLDGLETLYRMLEKHQSRLLLCGVNPQPLGLMQRAGFADNLGPDNLLPDLTSALALAQTISGNTSGLYHPAK